MPATKPKWSSVLLVYSCVSIPQEYYFLANVKYINTEVLKRDKYNLFINELKEISKDSSYSVYLYDVLGRLVFQNENINATTLDIDSIKSSNNVLFVKVVLEDQTIATKKIIF